MIPVLYYFLYFTNAAQVKLNCVKVSPPVSVTDFHFVIPGLINHVLLMIYEINY